MKHIARNALASLILCFSLLLLMAAYSCFMDALDDFMNVPAEIRVRKSIRSGTFELPELNSAGEYRAWANEEFDFLDDDEREPIIAAINEMPDVSRLRNLQRDAVTSAIRHSVIGATSNVVAGVINVVLGLLSVWCARRVLTYSHKIRNHKPAKVHEAVS